MYCPVLDTTPVNLSTHILSNLFFFLTFYFTFTQTTQGVQVNCFRTLDDLVLGYQDPHKGLVTPLLYPVPRDVDPGDESSGTPPVCDR